jgi:hypothetical protein
MSRDCRPSAVREAVSGKRLCDDGSTLGVNRMDLTDELGQVDTYPNDLPSCNLLHDFPFQAED